MKKTNTKKVSTPKTMKDLAVKDAAQVVGGRPTESLSLNYSSRGIIIDF